MKVCYPVRVSEVLDNSLGIVDDDLFDCLLSEVLKND